MFRLRDEFDNEGDNDIDYTAGKGSSLSLTHALMVAASFPVLEDLDISVNKVRQRVLPRRLS